MNDTQEGAGARAAQDPAGDPASDRSGEPSSPRSLFGRLIDALAPQEPHGHDAEAKGGQKTYSGLASLRNMRVDDIAISKAEMVSVPVTISRDELIEVFRDSGFSRLPVYEGELDQALGFLLLKDVVLRHGFDLESGALDLRSLVRPLLFVPPSMPLTTLLTKMQSERIHMALVIDEFGGVEGLVTIEDLLEQIVGEIEDEHDIEEGAAWSEVAPGVWEIEARAELEEFQEATGIDLSAGVDDEDVETIGGLAFMLTGYVPAVGEKIHHPAGWEIEVLQADQRLIQRLSLRPAAAAGAPQALGA